MTQNTNKYFVLHFVWLLILQLFLADRISLFGVTPDLIWLGLVWSLFRIHNSVTFLIAFVSSLLLDSNSGFPLGTTGFAYLVVLFFISVFFTYGLTFSPNRWFVLSTFGNLFVTFIFFLLTMLQDERFFYLYFRFGVMSVLYTSFFAFVLAVFLKWKEKYER